jgi:hypothetical protein
MNERVPERARQSLCWLGGVPAYIKEYEGVAERGYEAFVVS